MLPGEIVAIGRQDLLAQARLDELLDPKTLEAVLERLEPLIEIEPVEPGRTLPVRMVDDEAFATIAATAAIDAAGLAPPTTGDRDISVVWAEGDAELLVHVADVTTSTGDGFIDVAIPVECDQTGRVDIVVTLVTAHPDRPFGAMLATTHLPHGPRAVVDRWSEPLIAFAWSIVATSASLIAGSVGRDRDGHQLSPSTLVASRQGLSVVPMAEHRFTTPSAGERVSTTAPSTGKASTGKASTGKASTGKASTGKASIGETPCGEAPR